MKYILGIILIAVFSLFESIPEVTAQSSEAVVQEFDTPVEAPNFALKDMSGKEVSLKDYRGKVVLLNFFTTW
jgi:cytochrome oxidase Cu insertion factor (SCO1/SenC/PrrC family)